MVTRVCSVLTSLAPCSEWKVWGCSVLTSRDLSEDKPACSVALLQQYMMIYPMFQRTFMKLCHVLPRLAVFCAENILP